MARVPVRLDSAVNTVKSPVQKGFMGRTVHRSVYVRMGRNVTPRLVNVPVQTDGRVMPVIDPAHHGRSIMSSLTSTARVAIKSAIVAMGVLAIHKMARAPAALVGRVIIARRSATLDFLVRIANKSALVCWPTRGIVKQRLENASASLTGEVSDIL